MTIGGGVSFGADWPYAEAVSLSRWTSIVGSRARKWSQARYSTSVSSSGWNAAAIETEASPGGDSALGDALSAYRLGGLRAGGVSNGVTRRFRPANASRPWPSWSRTDSGWAGWTVGISGGSCPTDGGAICDRGSAISFRNRIDHRP